MLIRKLQRNDKDRIRTILIQTDVFKPEEIDVAMELIDEFLDKPEQKDYDMYCAVDEERAVIGYLCVGPTSMTAATYDLYWIAVDPGAQRKGIGATLNHFCEDHVKSIGGRLIVAETSSQSKYSKTRAFYLREGYSVAATIKDYYDVGDDLVIFTKYLHQ